MQTSAIHRQHPLGPLVGVVEAWERAYWAFEFRINEAELLDIIVMTGDRVEDVQMEVERRRAVL